MSPAPAALFVRHMGQGGRRVLALHCTMAHSGAWRGLAAELGDIAGFTAPDMFSHGRSPDWDGQGDITERMVAAMLPLMPDGPFDVLGHSYGAVLALLLAVRRHPRLRSVTLIEPVFFAALRETAPELLAEERAAMTPVFAALSGGDPALAARRFNRRWGGGDGRRWPQLPAATRAAMARGVEILPLGNPVIYGDRPGLLRPGVPEALDVPILLIRGGRSLPVIAAVNDALAARFPNVRQVAIAEGGHMVPVTHPSETAAAIRKFWAGT